MEKVDEMMASFWKLVKRFPHFHEKSNWCGKFFFLVSPKNYLFLTENVIFNRNRRWTQKGEGEEKFLKKRE